MDLEEQLERANRTVSRNRRSAPSIRRNLSIEKQVRARRAKRVRNKLNLWVGE